MPEYAKGLKLDVNDRDKFKQFVKDNAQDPGMQMENWGQNSVPKSIYIARYNEDNPSYYKTYDEHVNEILSWNYWNEPLLHSAIEANILEKTDEYNVELVENQND